MSRLIFPVLSLSLCLLMSNPVGAQGDEQREQIERLKREAMELIQSGQKDRAEELLKKVARLTQETDKEREAQADRELERPENRERALAGLERRIEELRQSGGDQIKIAQAERMAEQLQARSGESPKPFRPEMVQMQPQPEAARRLEHMRAAVEHLRQAGLVDAANHVNEMADRLQRELHHEGRGREGEGDPMREIMKQLGEMRREIGELRERLDRQEK